MASSLGGAVVAPLVAHFCTANQATAGGISLEVARMFRASDPYDSRKKVWCNLHPCVGVASMSHTLRGVNYGGRFVPEKYLGLYGTAEYLFKDVKKSPGKRDVGLCDLDTPDSGQRMARFLDDHIKREHFARMAELGFNIIRLPLGYWNLIDLPEGKTPVGPRESEVRWRNLQNLMNASAYLKWINMTFQFAREAGIKVMPDLHSAPGGQSGNQNTGCDLGLDSHFHMTTESNLLLAVRTVEVMAKLCASHGETCFGIELLNEPYGASGDDALRREALASFYDRAIHAARAHLDWNKPIVIMEWPNWLPFWKDQAMYPFDTHGHIVFSSHFYEYPNPWTNDTEAARKSFKADLIKMRAFFEQTRYEILVSEYALNSHGNGFRSDTFNYDGLVGWFVDQFQEMGFGSMIWNFDSWFAAWGPVVHETVGRSTIKWKEINGKTYHGRGWGRGRGRGRGRGLNRG